MTRVQLYRRFAWALLFAVAVAIILTATKAYASDGDSFPVQTPMESFCQNLEPFGYWYHFWDCYRVLGR